jgi:hypothetical protein
MHTQGETMTRAFHNERWNTIANQLIKGCSKTEFAEKYILNFKKKHQNLIDLLFESIPSSINTGVVGAIGKGILYYGEERMTPFIKAIGKCDFNGPDDPAHVLWIWLLRNTGHNNNQAYRRTVTAIRASLKGKKVSNKNLRPSMGDIFEWDTTLSKMTVKQKNQWTEGLKRKRRKSKAKTNKKIPQTTQQHLLNLIELNGGSITPRQLKRNSKFYRKPPEIAQQVLDDLTRSNLVKNELGVYKLIKVTESHPIVESNGILV